MPIGHAPTGKTGRGRYTCPANCMTLDVDTERRALQLFRRLLELDPTEREAFDAELAQTDPEVSRRVRAMLHRHQSVTERIERPWLDLMATDAPPLRLGAFTLTREIGRGGMGIVALGEREADGFVQQVAIKWIPALQVDAPRRARFLFERDVVARLRHPHIAQLVDGGEGPAGELWYAMELVEGSDLPAHCRRHDLDLRARVALLLDLCDAVACAHRNAILHRDIKPGNVLVTADGQLKLIDFGIAKALDGDSPDLTRDAAPMTPRYASPEQLRGERPTTASDVWQLGALAYEVMSGSSARKEGEREIPPPSRRAKALGDAPGTDPRQARLAPALAGDLDAVIMRALHQDPAQRYASVDALAQELRDWRDGRPLASRRHERWYAARRFLSTHRWAAGFAAFAAAALLTATLVSAAAERRAREEARIANRTAELVSDMFLSSRDGTSLTTMTLRDFFSHIVETAIADTQLPGASRYRLLRDLAPRAAEIGAVAASENAARAVIGLASQQFGAASYEVAEAQDVLVSVALVGRGHAAAREMQAHLEQAASIYRSLALEQHVDYLGHLRTRVRLQHALGEYAPMLETARELLARTSAHPEASVVQKLQARAVLANAYDANGQVDQAAAEADRAIEQGEALLQAQPSLAGTIEWLQSAACNWHARSDAESGIVRCEQLIKQLESAGRIESRNGQEALLALGMAQARLGRSEAALATYRRAEHALIAVEGPDTRSAGLGRILRNVGATSFKLGRYADAEAAQRLSLEIGSAFMGAGHPSALEVRMELADTLLALERPADAGKILAEGTDLAGLSGPQRARWDGLRARTQGNPR